MKSTSMSVVVTLLALPFCLSQAHARPIQIVSATYGSLAKGKTCDATGAVASMCSGQSRCDVNIQNALCSDPDFLAVKQAQIRYRCGRKTLSIVADEYKTTTIACE